jgi:TPP-dependent pyruvate/acetoin dehydrogenase alpha subunit
VFRRENDPIERFRTLLEQEGTLSGKSYMDLKDEVEQQIQEAVAYAERAPLPRPEEALEDLFVNP